ncbi:1-phosphatidylinositol 3-phosphate 5-kinase fab1 [Rhodotorula toruloides]|nr:1-phosphatidylinositol 3-phosphate 5-kinase fab1 [Rhodotorula toruloides]
MSSTKKLRACLMCSFLATPAEFRKQGCPNCEDKLEMKGDADRVLSCTTGQFDGVIAAINPEESWVSDRSASRRDRLRPGGQRYRGPFPGDGRLGAARPLSLSACPLRRIFLCRRASCCTRNLSIHQRTGNARSAISVTRSRASFASALSSRRPRLLSLASTGALLSAALLDGLHAHAMTDEAEQPTPSYESFPFSPPRTDEPTHQALRRFGSRVSGQGDGSATGADSTGGTGGLGALGRLKRLFVGTGGDGEDGSTSADGAGREAASSPPRPTVASSHLRGVAVSLQQQLSGSSPRDTLDGDDSAVVAQRAASRTRSKSQGRSSSGKTGGTAADSSSRSPTRQRDQRDPIPFPSSSSGVAPSPSQSRRSVRPVRLSGALPPAPSVSVNMQNAEPNVSVPPGRNSGSDYRYTPTPDSPNASDFDLGASGGRPSLGQRARRLSSNLAGLGQLAKSVKAKDEDALSVWSVGTGAAKGSPSAVEAIRKMQEQTLDKKVWIADKAVRECEACNRPFNALRRRHHCRISSNWLPTYGRERNVRICDHCMAQRRNKEALRITPTTTWEDAASVSRLPPPKARPASPPRISAFETPQTPSTIATVSKVYRPSSLRQRQSRLSASIHRVDLAVDRISEAGSDRPATPVFEEAGDASPAESRQHSPKSSMHRAQLEQLQQAQRSVNGDTPLDSGIEPGLQSPTLSVATAPFRRELGEEDHPTADEAGDEAEDEAGRRRLKSHGDGDHGEKGVVPESAGLGLDFGEEGSFSVMAAAAASDVDGSHLLAQRSGDGTSAAPARQSSFLPNLGRSTSRFSTHLLDYLPEFLADAHAPVNPDIYHADAFRAVEAVDIPLSQAALSHIRLMIRQSLERENIPDPSAWVVELERLLFSVADRLAILDSVDTGTFDVHDHIRIKRIPGGRPRDSEFVNGIVITKNVMQKRMPRQLSNPKIMLLSFGLEYQRGDAQYFSLDKVIDQEREHLRNVITRVTSFFPQIVLCERNVSSIALEYLKDRGIAVARHVKPEVLAAISRSFGADILPSTNALFDPKLGRCRKFSVQTFVHPDIPGKRKTVLRFEGGEQQAACTIVLRGASMEVLGKIKRIIEMLALVVYHAHLEGYLLHDERIEVVPPLLDQRRPSTVTMSEGSPANADAATVSSSLSEKEAMADRIAETIRPYESTALSSSALVQYPPPYPLQRVAEEERVLRELREQREAEETRRILEEETASRLSTSTTPDAAPASGETASSGSSIVDVAPSAKPASIVHPSDAALVAPALDSTLVSTPRRPADLAKETDFRDAEEEHAQHLVKWEDYRHAHPCRLDPLNFQHIYVLESLVHVGKDGEPDRLCRPPQIRMIDFYRENDTTIGQYLRDADASLRAQEPCPSPSCHEPLSSHARIFVHDSLVLKVRWENSDNEVLRGAVGMSAICRRDGCACTARLVRASIETTRLSFGKFLELSFYPSDQLACANEACGHDGQLDHVRYWHFGDVRVAFAMARIDLRNIATPPRQIKVRPERRLELRNLEYNQILLRTDSFFDSAQARIAAFKYEGVPPELVEESKTVLASFASRCEGDRQAIKRLLLAVYDNTEDSNGSEMTSVRRLLQEKSHAFDADWAALVKRVMPMELPDLRKASTAQLKRFFPEAGIGPATQRSASSSLPPALEVDESADGVEPSAAAVEPGDEAAEEAENAAAASVRDAEIQIEPPSPPRPADSLSASRATITVPLSVSDSATPTTLRRASLSGSDLDSDSTVHADEPTATLTRNTSLFIRQRVQHTDDTSAAESESEQSAPRRRRQEPNIASLVNVFDGAAGSLSRNSTFKAKQSSPARPGFRRIQTDKPPSSAKIRPRPNKVPSDTDTSYARNVGVSHLMDRSLSAAAARPSRIPARKPLKAETDHGASAPGTASTSPISTRPSSRAASRTPASRTASRPSSPVTARKPAGSPPAGDSRSGRRAAPLASESSVADHRTSSRSRNELGLDRPTASSTNKIATRRVVSTGTGRFVSSMRRRFEKAAEQSERSAVTRKRARPIITSQPTVRIFDNIRDAIKEDSSDEEGAQSDARSAEESDGADDEFDDEHDAPEPEDMPGGAVDGPAAPEPEAVPRPQQPTLATSSMADALARSNSAARSDVLLLQPSSSDHASGERSDSDYPSIPHSPTGADSFTFPRMSEGESSGTERRSLFNALSSLWNYRNGDFSPLAYPTLPTEHVYADNPILVREDEPTSIIAHALSSRKYYQAFEHPELPRIRDGLRAGNDAASEKFSIVSLEEPDVSKAVEEMLRASTQRSFKLGDLELGDISARCTVFWVEQFEALRRQCGCDTQFVESLSRCLKWDAAGGKSKVDFLKTLDDRFIVKQLSKPEMEVFARFAPAYFQYMADALFQGRPTLLAKVFGIYRVSLGKQYRNVDFLVMENLFYARQLKQIFDLKGSTRNRRVDENNPVLLDENLLELSLKNPFYVREESKQLIRQAVWNDSQFLSDLNVMDYSLVVGVDAVKSELVVGIVDYIRTYTWDKRIESWVKETTFLGGASKAGGPTVITPKQYKMRFREAIDGYLLLSPTPWLDLAALRAGQGNPVKTAAPVAPANDGAADNASVLLPSSATSTYSAPPPSDTSSVIAAASLAAF